MLFYVSLEMSSCSLSPCTSDCFFCRLFFIDSSRPTFQLIAESEQQARSLLCVEAVALSKVESVGVITAGGNGDLALWDFAAVLRKFLTPDRGPEVDLASSRSTCGSSACDSSELLRPDWVSSFPSHQCTVTCLATQVQEGKSS